MMNLLVKLQCHFLSSDPSSTVTQITGSQSPSNIQGGVQNVVWTYFFPTFMTIATALLITGFITAGLRLASSAIFENSRSRVGAIIGLFATICGVLIVVNAQKMVGALAGINLFG